ncbi:hypothetical protein MTR67_043219 [Solanum verrucosum]|uniref:Reverse transcriptase/retrotransposon-derived protein RNase H-like domain-containing protein n=1 Tax=Solanum verrucosum TaxID=315347 RepID=A0AAF0ZUX5_SOLVR|nr:hypothetical protein MTR67_043219 [Solanum verrucosum]
MVVLDFNKSFPDKAPPRLSKERVFNPKSQEKASGSSFSTFARCGKSHMGKYLVGIEGCHGCGKRGHKMRDFPILTAKGREGKKAPPCGLGTSAPPSKIGFMHFRLMVDKRRSEDEHKDHLRIVLQVLKEQLLYAKFSKCEFLLRSVAFLGHVVSSKGIDLDPKKTDAVKSLPRLLIPSNIRKFFGSVGYNKRFVEGFSSIASPLMALTQKKAKFIWSEDCEKTFQELKDRLTFVPALTLLEGTDGFVVYYDTSRIGLGCANAKWESHCLRFKAT